MVAALIKTPTRPRRRGRAAAERWGRMAEALAAILLTLKGYRILAWRARTPAGEIDLVARRGDTLAIVEVKARAAKDRAIEALTPAACRRLERAAASWRGRWGLGEELTTRFDAVLVAPWSLPVHLISAWREDEIWSGSAR